MKRQKIIILIGLLVGCVAIAGCKKKENEQTEVTTIEVTAESSEEVTITPNTSDNNSLESEEEDETDTKEEYIKEADAITAIQDIIGEKGYYFELVNEDLELNNRSYYEYQISDGSEPILPLVLVDKITGQLYCYYEDKTVADFKEHPLYVEKDTKEGSTLEEFTKEDALAKLENVSLNDLDLPASLTEYKIIFDDWTTNVEGKACYGINVYSDEGENMVNMGLYYVSVDGTVMYRFDSLLDDFVEIKEVK